MELPESNAAKALVILKSSKKKHMSVLLYYNFNVVAVTGTVLFQGVCIQTIIQTVLLNVSHLKILSK